MRDIEGYVLIGKTEYVEHLFGEPKVQGAIYENIQSNGITPFKTILEAKKAAKIILDIDFFADKSNLIVIRKERDDRYKADILLGPLLNENAKSAYPLPGAFLRDNGYQSYRRVNGMESPFKRALHQAEEINRQCENSATIAQFNLKRLVEFFRR